MATVLPPVSMHDEAVAGGGAMGGAAAAAAQGTPLHSASDRDRTLGDRAAV